MGYLRLNPVLYKSSGKLMGYYIMGDDRMDTTRCLGWIVRRDDRETCVYRTNKEVFGYTEEYQHIILDVVILEFQKKWIDFQKGRYVQAIS